MQRGRSAEDYGWLLVIFVFSGAYYENIFYRILRNGEKRGGERDPNRAFRLLKVRSKSTPVED